MRALAVSIADGANALALYAKNEALNLRKNATTCHHIFSLTQLTKL